MSGISWAKKAARSNNWNRKLDAESGCGEEGARETETKRTETIASTYRNNSMTSYIC